MKKPIFKKIDTSKISSVKQEEKKEERKEEIKEEKKQEDGYSEEEKEAEKDFRNFEKSLEDEFSEFEKSQSEFEIEPEEVDDTKQVKKNISSLDVKFVATDDQKELTNKVFGFLFFILDGFHAFFYEKFVDFKISKEEMSLTDIEKKSLERYMYTKEIVEFIEKYFKGVWVGLVHYEYLMYLKFKTLKELHKMKKADA